MPTQHQMNVETLALELDYEPEDRVMARYAAMRADTPPGCEWITERLIREVDAHRRALRTMRYYGFSVL